MTRRLSPADLPEAARFLQQGCLVAFPTETVYGLGANATNGTAVARIFEAKGRPSFNPLIVHVACLQAAQALAKFDETALSLAQAFWPGPLSLVLPVLPESGLSPLVTAGLGTVAIRIPAHPLARDLLQMAGCPVAAPSANPSGQVSPTTADHVLAGLEGRIDAVLDGGPCPVGLESTIVGGVPLRLLRPGGVSAEALEDALGHSLPTGPQGSAITAPGQLSSHYAPTALMRLNADGVETGEVLLGFGHAPAAALNLSVSGDLAEAAANLFAMLRDIDRVATDRGATRIAVSRVPISGLGRAINDRLSRAAAPRG